jgi:hypothetical protein
VEEAAGIENDQTPGKRPLARPRHRWEDSIKMNPVKLGVWVWTGFIWLKIGTDGRIPGRSDS